MRRFCLISAATSGLWRADGGAFRINDEDGGSFAFDEDGRERGHQRWDGSELMPSVDLFADDFGGPFGADGQLQAFFGKSDWD